MKIAIQGIRGAFHEAAAQHFFGPQVEVVPAVRFSDLFAMAEAGEHCEGAVAAIENSIAGSILGNYQLLRKSRLTIAGEVFLPIHQQLMALPGVGLEEIEEVHSHPMALAQCAAFFTRFPHIRLVEADDTAASAERIARQQLRRRAAIAGSLAAELYGLNIIAPQIEDHPQNYTRFLALLPPDSRTVGEQKPNKASICFALAHQPAALATALAIMAEHNANLTKIQSLPIMEKVWEYRFFVDYLFDSESRHQHIVRALEKHVSELQVLGTYPASSL